MMMHSTVIKSVLLIICSTEEQNLNLSVCKQPYSIHKRLQVVSLSGWCW